MSEEKPTETQTTNVNNSNEEITKKISTIELTDEEIHRDPYCQEHNPQKITFNDITSAAFMIKDGIENTPCSVRLILKKFFLKNLKKIF